MRRTIDDRNHSHERARLRWARRLARRLHVNSVPTFFLVRHGHRPRELRYDDFRPRSFTRPIDRVLRR
jgi:protein-disulfide isomerase-like protein with CxxC motif